MNTKSINLEILLDKYNKNIPNWIYSQCVIYRIFNPKTNSCYVGQTKNLFDRLYSPLFGHITKLNLELQGYPTEKNLYSVIKSEGVNNFFLEILTSLDDLEKYYISKYNSYEEGLNETKGGLGNPNYKIYEDAPNRFNNELERLRAKVYTRWDKLHEQNLPLTPYTYAWCTGDHFYEDWIEFEYNFDKLCIIEDELIEVFEFYRTKFIPFDTSLNLESNETTKLLCEYICKNSYNKRKSSYLILARLILCSNVSPQGYVNREEINELIKSGELPLRWYDIYKLKMAFQEFHFTLEEIDSILISNP